MRGKHVDIKKVSFAGILITIGIIFGDIGTSPLYVFRAIVSGNTISREIVYGAVSCILWTLTLQTTVKYVIITLRADNKGEGGIFSLYALLRRYKSKTLAVIAIIGGSALFADGIITPPISITSAIEGLHTINHNVPVIPIVISILFVLFFVQQFGTGFIGRSFGPIMVTWFLMIGTLGLASIIEHPEILKAVDPSYAYALLTQYPGGFWLLGAVFLCTTGAEALYSDLGHCGKKNIRISWIFVKLCLLLNYFGQGAWLMLNEGSMLGNVNPFYQIMPGWFIYIGVAIATLAAVVASQALISGSFTLLNEAIRLNFFSKQRIVYPTDIRGQIYIPSLNWTMLAGCIGVVLYFRESSAMEAAYGMAIILTMISTSTLLVYYLRMKHYPFLFVLLFAMVYSLLEGSFLISNISKIPHGGWITLIVSSFLFFLMYCWHEGRKIRNRYVEFTQLSNHLPLIKELAEDITIPKTSTHLVYLTSANHENEIEKTILYSIFQKQPKRADVYWLLHVDVMDNPYDLKYKVTSLIKEKVFKIDFRLGFRIEPRINLFFRQVVSELNEAGEVDISSRYESLHKNKMLGDFRFVVIEKHMSYDNDFPLKEKIILNVHAALKSIGLNDEKSFGLDNSNIVIEKVPIIINPSRDISLKRI